MFFDNLFGIVTIEVISIEKKNFFNKLVSFTTSVHQVTHELTKDVKSDSISHVQYNILEFIKVNQPVTPSDINDCLDMAMPNTSRELKKLDEKRLIERINNPEDRRKHYVRLSLDGEALMNEAFLTIESRFMKRIQNASEEELKQIEKAIDILQRKLFY